MKFVFVDLDVLLLLMLSLLLLLMLMMSMSSVQVQVVRARQQHLRRQQSKFMATRERSQESEDSNQLSQVADLIRSIWDEQLISIE